MPLSNFIFSTYTAPTDIYTLSLHDALPISPLELGEHGAPGGLHCPLKMHGLNTHQRQSAAPREQPRCARACRQVRSEEHTSELQSHSDLVCRLLLEKKNNRIN